MPSKVVQDLTSTGTASRGGAAQEQWPVGRLSMIELLAAGAAQLAPVAPWIDGVFGFV